MSDIAEWDGYLILDDFLSSDEIFAIQLYMQFENYYLVHSLGWSKSWRMTDGEPLVSVSYFYSLLTEKTTVDDNVITSGIDILSKKIGLITSHLRNFWGGLECIFTHNVPVSSW